MALCKDEITKHLKSFKYNTILGIKAVYKTSRTLKFQYEHATRHFVKPVQRNACMNRGAPVDGLFTTAELLEDDRLFIFTSVLKARKVVVEEEKSGTATLEVEVPAMQGIRRGLKWQI